MIYERALLVRPEVKQKKSPLIEHRTSTRKKDRKEDDHEAWMQIASEAVIA